jgi:multidrug resistance efflux pump/transcriptional regulator with GAF, ATPase, and Fis domain
VGHATTSLPKDYVVTSPEPPGAPATDASLREEVERLRLLRAIDQEFNSSLDLDELLPRVFHSVLSAVRASGGSLWIAEDEDMLRCHLALGGASERLVGARMPVGAGFVGDVASRPRTTIVARALEDPRHQQAMEETGESAGSTVMATAIVAKGVTIGAFQVSDKDGGSSVFDAGDRALLEGLAGSAAIAIRNAQLHAAEKRAADLALLLDISREITATLDLDRVLRSVVNLAARALTFDRGAVGLLDHGRCEIRAIAGAETVDATDTRISDLAARAEWAAVRGGELFYLTDREAPGSDAERMFVGIFGGDLAAADVRSALYIPLKDEEGLLGVLAFEAERPELASASQVELATILANQTAVALRNAQLYHQVPLAATLGTLAARRRAFLEMPRSRRRLYLATAVVVLALLTLVRWPLRVSGDSPRFRPEHRTDIRALVPGVVERMLVREGDPVPRGAVIAQLRAPDLRAQLATAQAELGVAERATARAAAGGDATEQQMQQARAVSLKEQVRLLDSEVQALEVRAPVEGTVLTARPEERAGLWLDAGDLVVTLGRTDTLELEFGVAEQDLPRVRPGQEVRLRVDALPQRTFSGRVTSIAQLPSGDTTSVYFPVRAAIPDPDGMLKPGMAAHARVLTDRASVLGRLFRAPVRWLRMLWWKVLP